MEGFHILQLVKTNINMWWMGDSIISTVFIIIIWLDFTYWESFSLLIFRSSITPMTNTFEYFTVYTYNSNLQEWNYQIFLCRIWNTLFVNMRERQYLKYNHLQRMNVLEWISIKSEKRDFEHYRDTHFELIVLSCLCFN